MGLHLRRGARHDTVEPVNTNEYLLGALRAEGLTYVFLVPGGLIDRFYPALALTPGLIPIVAIHRFMAMRCRPRLTTWPTQHPFDPHAVRRAGHAARG